ncbi:zinc-dependent alcohol dehydrogenase [Paenibacillus cremeus]|uniref:Zinc-binding dehydrogenase n=1 Tax=Paenibacillus cremeus TaxID=2163881 RepID=A0A559JHM8_9BACL|nr:zinc-binding dehydrogenase [Paenibacillus cremeus]TVX99384.1 zinc-binding dehydrogenase [Paenibacillus cremeus]
MKKVAITGVRQAEIIEVPTPVPTGDLALVKILVTPMCTEYKAYLQGTYRDCLGHEAVGEVVELAQPGHVKVGDRVVVTPLFPCGQCRLCRQGDYIHCQHNHPLTDATYAQYILKPSWVLFKIRDDISNEHAALAICGLGPSFGAFQTLGVSAFDTVLITGLGPVGIGAVINAKYRGSRVIAVESNAYRVQLAQELGVDAVINPADPDAVRKIKELCDGEGPSCAVDCSGVVAAHRLCIDSVRRKGKVAFIGESFTETPVTISNDLIRKGIHLIGSWHYNANDFPSILQVIRNSPHLDKFITHVLPMSRINEAFEISVSQNNAKILLKTWE